MGIKVKWTILTASFLMLGMFLWCGTEENNIIRIETDGNDLYVVYVINEYFKNEEPIIIGHYQEEESDEYWLFLPSFCRPEHKYDRVNLTAYGMEQFWYDDMLVAGGETDEIAGTKILAEGEHKLFLNDREYTLHIRYGSEIQSLFIHTSKQDNGYLKTNKENSDSGYLTLMGPDGALKEKCEIADIHARGNASFTNYLKKSYAISLSDKISLSVQDYPSKKWVLVSNAQDDSQLNNKILYTLSEAVGLQYTPQVEFTDVWINDCYEGMYLISSKIDISDSSVAIRDIEREREKTNQLIQKPYIYLNNKTGEERRGFYYDGIVQDITGGYLLEHDFRNRYDEESSGFISLSGQEVVIKKPEFASVEEVNYIAGLYQEFEDAVCSPDGVHPVNGKHYSEYIDMQSWVKKYIIEELSMNINFGLSSSFFYKPEGKESKFYAGPVWDFDEALGHDYERGDILFTETDRLLAVEFAPMGKELIYSMLYSHEDFREEVKTAWREEIRPEAMKMTEGEIESLNNLITPSRNNDSVRWEKTFSLDPGVKKLEFWRKRIHYLDTIWKE